MANTPKTGATRPRSDKQPLDPLRLLDMPIGREVLRPALHIPCNAWYQLLEDSSDPTMRPRQIRPETQERFAKLVRRTVFANVSIDINGRKNEVVDPHAVESCLDDYYETFRETLRYKALGRQPTNLKTLQRLKQLERERAIWVDKALVTAHMNYVLYPSDHLEIGVLYALRRACNDRELMEAPEAIDVVLGAYGKTLEVPLM